MLPRALPGLLLLFSSVAAAQYSERPLPVRMPQIQAPAPQPVSPPAVKVSPAPSGVRPSAAPQVSPTRTAAPKAATSLPGRVVPSGVRSTVVTVSAGVVRPASVTGGVRPIPFAPVQVNAAQVRQLLSGPFIVVRPRSAAPSPFNPLGLPQLALGW